MDNSKNRAVSDPPAARPRYSPELVPDDHVPGGDHRPQISGELPCERRAFPGIPSRELQSIVIDFWPVNATDRAITRVSCPGSCTTCR